MAAPPSGTLIAVAFDTPWVLWDNTGASVSAGSFSVPSDEDDINDGAVVTCSLDGAWASVDDPLLNGSAHATRVRIWDKAGSLLGTYSTAGWLYGPAMDEVGHVYVIETAHFPTLTAAIKKLDRTATVLASYSISVSDTRNLQIGVSRDGTKVYFGVNGDSSYTVYPLAGSPSTFATEGSADIPGNEQLIVVFRNGNVLLTWRDFGATFKKFLKLYDSSGAFIRRYDMSGSGLDPTGNNDVANAVTLDVDDTKFWWDYYVTTPNVHRFDHIRVSDGAVLDTFDKTVSGNTTDYGQLGVFLPPLVVTPVGGLIPVPPSAVPLTPCTPQSEVSGAARGQAGCNTGGVGWVSSYAGPYGSVPAHADPVDGETLTGKSQVDLWMELVHEEYPAASPDTTTYRRASVELADDPSYHGGRKPAALLAIGDIEHGLGNEQGTFEAASVDLQLHDGDQTGRLIRTLLEDQELELDEVDVFMASPAARAALATPRALHRAAVQKVVLNSPTQATITAEDSLFSGSGPLNPDRMWPPLIPQFVEITTPTPPDVLAKALPELIGEKSDEGATDPRTGKTLSKGLLPPLFLGVENIPLTVQPSGAFPWDGRNGPDVLQNAATVTIAGSTWGAPLQYPAFQVALLTPDSNPTGYKMSGVILDDNSLRQAGQYVTSGPPFDQRVVTKIWATTPLPTGSKLLVLMMPLFSTFNPVTNPYDTTGVRYKIEDLTITNPDGPPHVNFSDPPQSGYYEYQSDWTSVTDGNAWPPAPGDIQTTTEPWDAYLMVGAPIYRGIRLYGSDLGNGDPAASRDRIALDPDTRQDILWPWGAAWPFANTYRVYHDAAGVEYWCTVFYAKGPLSEDHKNGVISFAFNAIGVEDVGDGTGLPIIDAHDAEQFEFENFLILNKTAGPWVTNTPGDYPAWADGTAKVRSSSFAARQTFTAGRLGGRGLTVGYYRDTPARVMDIIAEWNRSTESKVGVNGHGQIVISGLDETRDSSTWPKIDHVTRMFRAAQLTFGEERENVAAGSCDWDPDGGKYRVGPLTVSNLAAIAKYKGKKKQGNVLESTILNDQRQWQWVLSRRVARLGVGITLASWPGDLGLLDYDVNGGVLATSIEGTGALGWVDRPCLIMRRHFNVQNRIVTYTLWDVQNALYATLLPGGLAQRFKFSSMGGDATFSSNPDVGSAFTS